MRPPTERDQSWAPPPLTTCENEPIHIPGRIQPFGILICLSEPDLRMEQVSANVRSLTGIAATDCLGKPLSSILRLQDGQDLSDVLLRTPKITNPFRFLRLADAEESPGWNGFFHRHDGRLILELEPAVTGNAEENFYGLIKKSLSAIQNADSLQELCERTVEEVQKISGFDRVMLYRFDRNWNGKVVAEHRSGENIDSYLGHHFPASDIPPQARAIFLSNWVRAIPDVHYVPEEIIPELNPETQRPLDLKRSFLRSVSPIHIQYLKNMDVASTMTVSLIQDKKLWGLISCHHRKPHLVPHQGRLACKFIGKLVSLQLHVKEEFEDLEYKRSLKAVHKKLLEFMWAERDLADGLIRHSPSLLDLVNANGAAAAIYSDGEWKRIGDTPTVPQLESLVDWLCPQTTVAEFFCTDELPNLYPDARNFKNQAAGLLAVPIPKATRSFVLWFRPEVLQSVTWAGNPSKSVERLPDGTLKIEPRASFESWKEIVQNHSTAWKQVEIEAALELRQSILELDLQRQVHKEQLARAEADRLGREKEEMLAIVSHDLQSPLSSIQITMQLLASEHKEKVTAHTECDAFVADFVKASKTIDSSIARMRRLISDLLDIARIEAKGFVIEAKVQCVVEIMKQLVAVMQPVGEAKGVHLRPLLPMPPCLALVDEDRIFQVLVNLVGNALKFTPSGGEVFVTLTPHPELGQVTVSVQDNGPGISAEHLPHVFDRFWQAQHRSGTGLGLAISKGIVEAHGGRISMASVVGEGTTVSFTLLTEPATAR